MVSAPDVHIDGAMSVREHAADGPIEPSCLRSELGVEPDVRSSSTSKISWSSSLSRPAMDQLQRNERYMPLETTAAYCDSSPFRTSMHVCTHSMTFERFSSALLQFPPHIRTSRTRADVIAEA
jgi:hypothetical protein